MTFSDITLLGKKILIGIIVALIPFLLLYFGLRLTQKLLAQPEQRSIGVRRSEHVRRSLQTTSERYPVSDRN